MNPKISSSQTALIAGLTLALVFTASTMQAGKPAPPPAKPVAIVYQSSSDGIYGLAGDGS